MEELEPEIREKLQEYLIRFKTEHISSLSISRLIQAQLNGSRIYHASDLGFRMRIMEQISHLNNRKAVAKDDAREVVEIPNIQQKRRRSLLCCMR